ncbi:ATPase [Streptomyces subrutilus]|uniref:histidine kinase n=1 Tax=Streptomyces subrutilus TaxID=36818 RepID=A0A5P2UZP8_9ACTN|nr:sensor histidine kinase [Streptomyces subrutilus]QEU82247.1 sensor histidine kinase [Streptomyces subrutilus]GGZ95446.1 ATPase [Streptomyces subrutilus]
MRSRVWPADRLRSVDPRLADAALALGLTAAAAVIGRQYHPAGWPPFDATAYALTALAGLPLAARRRAPVWALVTSCLGFACYLAAGYQPSLNFWAPAMALYGVAARRPPRTTAACAALCGAVVFHSGLAAPELGLTVTVVQAVGVPAVVWTFGNGARTLAERNRQLAALTARLHREQEWRERQAVSEEQRRIARELHDVVAHHMSVISVQAGMAGYVFPSAPEQARAALVTISETSQEGLRELRRILTLLRSAADGADGRAPYAPIPGLSGLREVAERVRAAGVAVDLRTDGVARPLPPGVELCAYRVVQEALTNVIKHARHAAVTVLVVHRPHELLVTITDDGRAGPAATGAERAGDRSDPAKVAPGTGHGLIGMRERARLYGGTVDAGPRTEGGFRVRLTLPVAAGPPAGPRKRPPT